MWLFPAAECSRTQALAAPGTLPLLPPTFPAPSRSPHKLILCLFVPISALPYSFALQNCVINLCTFLGEELQCPTWIPFYSTETFIGMKLKGILHFLLLSLEHLKC